MAMTNFYCLKWGTKYGPQYVNRLFNSLKVHYDNPFSFRIVNVTSDVEIFNNKNYSVDDEKDLIFINKLYKRFGEKLFRMNVYEIVNLWEKRKLLF